jgi:hypothetical protein
MRIAVSFSGLPRIVPRSLDCWKNLIARYRADVYLHTWNTDAKAIRELTSVLSPRAMMIETPRVFVDIDRYAERACFCDPYSVFSMWTSIAESMKMAERCGVGYDRIIRARTDVVFEEFQLLDVHGVVIPGKPAEIYDWQGQRYPGWHDLMAYGDTESMLAYADTLQQIQGIYDEGSQFFSEFFLSTHLYRSKTNTTHHAIHADIART